MRPEIMEVPTHFPECYFCPYALAAKDAAMKVRSLSADTYAEATVNCVGPNIGNNSTTARVSSWVTYGRPPPEKPGHEYPYDLSVQCPVAVERLLNQRRET